MNTQKIKELAVNFENIAERYAMEDEEAKALLNSMRPFISDAKSESISDVIDHVPGRYWFDEGSLSRYSDLEGAYAEFKFALTYGDDNDEANSVLDSIKKMQEQFFGKS